MSIFANPRKSLQLRETLSLSSIIQSIPLSNPQHSTAKMSADDDGLSSSSASSGSENEEEDIAKSGLVATRAKRRTAGNLYETLRANLDDEELQKELLAEDEAEDAEDYFASDREDDDAAMESSSSDEDAAEGADDDEGERELKKAERAEQRKKRKVADARMRIPGLAAPKKKRVKLADDVKGGDGEEDTVEDSEEAARQLARKKKKKSERSNWLPEAADAPTRQSRRELAVKNREVIHANLKESAQRSEKQKRLMENAAKRVRMTDRLPLTQEERFEKCRRIEKETAKELGRTEREEAERIRLREEALAAKRKRDIEGPVMRWWSGSGVFEDGKLRVKRLGSTTMAEWEVEAKKKDEEARIEAERKAEEARREAERREEEAREEARRQAEEARLRELERLEEERKERERVEAERIEAEQAEAAKKENEKAAMDLIDWGGESSSRPGTADQAMEDAPTLENASAMEHSVVGERPTKDDLAIVEEPPKDDSTMGNPDEQPLPVEPLVEQDTEQPVQPTGGAADSWLSGIHEYAAQAESKPLAAEVPYTPSAPALNTVNPQAPAQVFTAESQPPQDPAQTSTAMPNISIQPEQLSASSTPLPSQVPRSLPSQPGSLPGTMTFSATPQPIPGANDNSTNNNNTTAPQAPPPPPAPPLREQAQRTLLILSSFPSLSNIPPPPPSRSRKSLASQTNPLEPTPLSNTLIPNSHPRLTAEETRYLSRTLKRNRLDALPEPPHKPKCAVTGWAAKYTDPKTGLPYADLQTYKIVQRLVAGGSAWCGFLGAWVGPQTAVKLRLGRPARGVPEGFAPSGEGEGEGEGDFKKEGEGV